MLRCGTYNCRVVVEDQISFELSWKAALRVRLDYDFCIWVRVLP